MRSPYGKDSPEDSPKDSPSIFACRIKKEINALKIETFFEKTCKAQIFFVSLQKFLMGIWF
jgi:hypothetical protein